MEYLKLGLLTWLASVCKPLSVQLIFLSFGEIHLNKNVCTAVHWAELCPVVISGSSVLWRQESYVWSNLWFMISFLHASAPYCYFYMHCFHLKTGWPFSRAGGCSNCSMSVFFLSFSGIFKACDTLFLFSWPTVLCQQGSICGSRGTRCSSQGASLKG